jgi:hypothetical protein
MIISMKFLHLNSRNLPIQQVEYIKRKARYACQQKKDINREKLKQNYSAENPMARIQQLIHGDGKNYGKAKWYL